MRPHIRLGFADFWPDFEITDNYFTQLLEPHYDIEICDHPDYLIYSCFGKSFRNHSCLRIFYTGENKRPNFRECDFAVSFDHSAHPRNYRLPLYALYGDVRQLVKRDFDPERVLAAKTKFCNFVYSNRKCKERNRFFELLSKYKRVDAGGRWLNNIGGRIDNKREFIRDYKFTIAFENTTHPGYTTEKIAEPMFEGSLPIYWGNPLVHLDFNPASFINAYDFANLEELVERVIAVDQDDALYCRYLLEPWYHDNQVNHFVDPANVLVNFRRILESDKTPVGQLKWWRRFAS